MAKLRAAIWQSREREIDKFIQTMADSLKPGLNVKAATDIFVALERPEIYEELVLARGWSPDEYQRWLASCLRRELLARP